MLLLPQLLLLQVLRLVLMHLHCCCWSCVAMVVCSYKESTAVVMAVFSKQGL